MGPARVATRWLAALRFTPSHGQVYPKPPAGHVVLFHATSTNAVLEKILREGIRTNRGNVWSATVPDKFHGNHPMVAFVVPADDPSVQQAERYYWTDVVFGHDIPATAIVAAYPVVQAAERVPGFAGNAVRLDHVLAAGVPYI